MAERLASIYGTEKDKVNCPFYYKIGACRHGARCSRIHNKPLFSPTILLENLYQTPDQIRLSAVSQNLPPPQIPQEDLDNHFDDFYHDVLEEMARYGPVDQLAVCENLADHLAGNTYVKFHSEEAAQAALNAMQGRWYAGRPVKAEFSPVTDFKEGKCRPFERYGHCERGDYCHFMHIRRHPGSALVEEPAVGAGRGAERRAYPARPRDRYYESRDYARGREGDKPNWLESASERGRKERDRGYDRGRDSYDPDRSRDYHYSRDWSRDRDRDRGRYSDYDRSYRSSRDRNRRGS